MSRIVYVVERVVLDVREPFSPDGRVSAGDWTGSNGDHRARVPVAAFADRALAERRAAELERIGWASLCPARFIDEDFDLAEGDEATVQEVLRRHGFAPPPVRQWDDARAEYRGVPFSDWWAEHAHALTPEIAAEVGAIVAPALYRVEARTLED